MNEETRLKGSVEVSVVFPAYNEADSLEAAVGKVTQALNDFTGSYEITEARMELIKLLRRLPRSILS